MRIFAVVVAGLLLAGCSDPNLNACEDALKATLKAPASYKRIKVTGNPGDTLYLIEYDAVNSYNAPIRGNGMCHLTKSGAEWTDTTPTS